MQSESAVRDIHPDTGISYCEWYAREISRPITGQSYPSLDLSGWSLDSLATSNVAIICDVCMDAGYSGLSVLDSIANLDGVILSTVTTDPGAQNRSQKNHFFEWSRNLAQLSAVAQKIIPELRPMTVPEQRNLGKYYDKLYRKI